MGTLNEIERAIVEHPERDDLRLEFADAIYPHDPHWAQYIRTFVTRANPKWEKLDQEKVRALNERMEAPFRRFGDVGIEPDRGFPSKAYLPLETFLAHGNEILSLAPILEIVVSIPFLGERGSRSPWNTYLPSLMACPALSGVRELTLDTGWFDFASMKHIIKSPHIENLLRLTPGDWHFESDAIRDQQEDEMWPLLLESPVFRRMINWGILHVTRRVLGDRVSKESHIEYDRPDTYTYTYEPMSEESRAIEQKYGYIPCLHAANWDATVLDVLRGIKPDYPVGATPTEAMYAVPPPLHRAW